MATAKWTDEKLDLMAASGYRGPMNQAEIMRRIPVSLRSQARSEATRQANMTGERFTDALRSFVYSRGF